MTIDEGAMEAARIVERVMTEWGKRDSLRDMLDEITAELLAVPSPSPDVGEGNRGVAAGPAPRTAGQPSTIVAGAVFVVPHPFCREKVSLPGDDPEGAASIEVMSWMPGVRFEYGDNAYGDDPDTVEEYDGLGAQILTVAAVFKPGRFPTRVFYTRKWRTPDGKEFGKGALRIKIIAAFKRLISGYQYQNPARLKTSVAQAEGAPS